MKFRDCHFIVIAEYAVQKSRLLCDMHKDGAAVPKALRQVPSRKILGIQVPQVPCDPIDDGRVVHASPSVFSPGYF